MAKSIYIVYEGDEWLSYNSMRIKCVCNSKRSAIRSILKNHKMKWRDFPDYETRPTKKEMACEIKDELDNNLQTQGHTVNYFIEEMAVGEWEG